MNAMHASLYRTVASPAEARWPLCRPRPGQRQACLLASPRAVRKCTPDRRRRIPRSSRLCPPGRYAISHDTAHGAGHHAKDAGDVADGADGARSDHAMHGMHDMSDPAMARAMEADMRHHFWIAPALTILIVARILHLAFMSCACVCLHRLASVRTGCCSF